MQAYGARNDEVEEAQKEDRIAQAKEAATLSAFLDPSKPWILVPDGSLLGFFEWVPQNLRDGPWSSFGAPYLYFLVYVISLAAIWCVSRGTGTDEWNRESNATPLVTYLPIEELMEKYPPYKSALWYQDLVLFLWTTCITLSVLCGPAKGYAFTTFTMWTWVVLNLRLGVSTLAPFFQASKRIYFFLEYTRFPVLMMNSLTFFFWNVVIGPFIYFVLKDPDKRARMLRFFTSWRLIQIHAFNIVYAYNSCIRTSPQRVFTFHDFIAGLVASILYIMFYLLILDRIGVHFYPVFSPRTPFLLGTWTAFFAVIVFCFFFWNWILAG